MMIDVWVARLARWAIERSDIRGIAIVGSYARGTQTEQSDIDVVVIADETERYLEDHAWLADFGQVIAIKDEDFGLVRCLRTFHRDGLEVEWGITDERWCATSPIDPGTARVLAGGMRVVHDPRGSLEQLLRASLLGRPTVL